MTTHRPSGIGSILTLLALAAFTFACTSSDDPDLPDLTCEADELLCEGACVDPQSDPAHCGACGEACAEGESCHLGSCTAACPEGESPCDDACTDLQSDPANCGACGEACGEGLHCVEGNCVSGCESGEERCAGACTDTGSDPANCGACGFHCGDKQVCAGGECACLEGLVECEGACIEANDLANCGACGQACEERPNASAVACEAQGCVYECAENFDTCEDASETGCETDLRESVEHCGACGTNCEAQANVASASCLDSTCHIATCNPGWENCDGDVWNGCETQIAEDAENCGGCGDSCLNLPHNAAAPACVDGACALSCEAGWGNCDGDVWNGCEAPLQEDPENCGACENKCGELEVCVSGSCVDTGWVEYAQWPMPSDTPEDEDYNVDGDIITDPKTSLSWERVDPQLSVLHHSLHQHCEGLTLGGFNDWRVPTTMEMITILDYSGANPAVAPVFEGTKSASYFTSTVALWEPDYEAWVVDFRNGQTGGMPDLDEISANVRCVRGGVAKGGDRFTSNAETVIDTRTLLEWERVAADAKKNHATAEAYCKDLQLGGHDDWRLPGIKELASLLDLRAAPAIDTTLFEGPAGDYWSGRARTGTNNMFGISFNQGYIRFLPKTTAFYTRCVRDWEPEP